MAPSATCRGIRSLSAIGVYCPSQRAFIFCHVPSPRVASRPWLRRAITSVCWPASVFTPYRADRSGRKYVATTLQGR